MKYKRKVFVDIPNQDQGNFWKYWQSLTPLEKENFKQCPKRDKLPKDKSLRNNKTFSVINNRREAKKVWKI